MEPCGCPDADRSCYSSACDPKQRHEKSSLPGCCRVAYRVPADDDARRNDRTACADHSDFSSISRSRTPTVDHCGFGLLFHLLSNPTGLPACRMLTPNLPTTIELRLTGQAALQPETETRQQSRKLPACMMRANSSQLGCSVTGTCRGQLLAAPSVQPSLSCLAVAQRAS